MAKKFLSDSIDHFSVEVNRNSFDRTKTRNASYNFGYLYPFHLRPVSNNTSWRFKVSGGFDLKPLIGVSQTHVKCNTAWFYVRNREIWDNFQAFSRQDPTKTSSSYVHPLINTADASAFKKGSLLNHLGIPVATYGVYQGNAVVGVVSSDCTTFTEPPIGSGFFNRSSRSYSVSPSFPYSFLRRSFDNWLSSPSGDIYCHMTRLCPITDISSPAGVPVLLSKLLNTNRSTSASTTNAVIYPVPMTKRISDTTTFTFHHINSTSNGSRLEPILSGRSFYLSFYRPDGDNFVFASSLEFTSSGTQADGTYTFGPSVDKNLSVDGSPLLVSTADFNFTPNLVAVSKIQALQDKYGSLVVVLSWRYSERLGIPSVYSGNSLYTVSQDETKPNYYNLTAGMYNGFEYRSDALVNTDVSSPFLGLGDDAKEHLSALPVRAYEACYNYRFRDRIHDPFRIDGEIAVDRYNTNKSDGLDSSTPLHLFKVNYESDYFTTCVASPQGNMFHQPLVGITQSSDPASGSAILHYSDDGTDYDIEVQTDRGGGLTGMNFHEEDADRLTVKTLQDAISYGISLHDISNVRALSKWYEATYRRGRFSHDEFVGAHFGKVPTSDAMHAPEYLGGDSLPLSVMRVLNNSTADGGVLGASGGLGSFATRKDHPDDIECYCDVDGFILGLCWFSVTPTYGQAIDKFWYRKMPGDYPTPEFADLGTMPVLNKELCPLQCDWDNALSDGYANGTFGYQRMYGDMIHSFDDAVGDYVDELSPLILNRLFSSVPKLGVDFLEQDPVHMNNIFVLDNDKDKIYGQWHIEETCKVWLQQTPNAQIF